MREGISDPRARLQSAGRADGPAFELRGRDLAQIRHQPIRSTWWVTSTPVGGATARRRRSVATRTESAQTPTRLKARTRRLPVRRTGAVYPNPSDPLDPRDLP